MSLNIRESLKICYWKYSCVDNSKVQTSMSNSNEYFSKK